MAQVTKIPLSSLCMPDALMTTSPFNLALRIFHLPACCKEQSLVHLRRREQKAFRVPEESNQARSEENVRPYLLALSSMCLAVHDLLFLRRPLVFGSIHGLEVRYCKPDQ